MGEYVQMFFGESSIILVAGFAIILNLILPKDQTDKEVEAEYIWETARREDDAVSAKDQGAGNSQGLIVRAVRCESHTQRTIRGEQYLVESMRKGGLTMISHLF